MLRGRGGVVERFTATGVLLQSIPGFAGARGLAALSGEVSPRVPLVRAVVTPERAVVGRPVSFALSVLDSDRPIPRVEWDFDGDGREDLFIPYQGRFVGTPTIPFTYVSPGRYTPRVRAMLSGGVTLTATASVEVLSPAKRCVLVASAYSLPDRAILVTGAPSESNALPTSKGPDAERGRKLRTKTLQNLRPIDSHALNAQAVELVPKFSIEMVDSGQASRRAVRVTLDDTTARKMLEERFEIVVYLDMKRVFEEEQAYTPYLLELPVDALSEGEHLLSISVASFADRTATVSRKFRIEPR